MKKRNTRAPLRSFSSETRSKNLVRTSARASNTPSQQKSTGPLSREHAPDYMIVFLIVVLIAVGAVIGYTNSPGLTEVRGLPSDFYTKKQFIATLIGVVAFFVTYSLKLDFWRKYVKHFSILAVFVAIAVRLFGTPIYGAYRWLDVGGISVQAAEVIKLAIVLWLSNFIYKKLQNGSLFTIDNLKRVLYVSVGVVIVVAGLQSDLGSAAVMVAMIFGALFIAGLPKKYILYSLVAIAIAASLAIIPSSYRLQRVETFFNPTADCEDTGYQVCQALISVGSGGVVGKGLGRSVQAYGYLPEALSDSIFAIIAENLGFFGAAIVLLVFLELFRRLHKIAIASPDIHNRYLVYIILLWLASQTAINVGAMIGLLPLKGITLPLISFGGTSIIFVLAALGICFKISRFTDLRLARLSESKGMQNNVSSDTKESRIYRRKS